MRILLGIGLDWVSMIISLGSIGAISSLIKVLYIWIRKESDISIDIKTSNGEKVFLSGSIDEVSKMVKKLQEKESDISTDIKTSSGEKIVSSDSTDEVETILKKAAQEEKKM